MKPKVTENQRPNQIYFQLICLKSNNYITFYRTVDYNTHQLDSASHIALECIKSGEPKKQSFVLYLSLIENAAGNYKRAYDYQNKYIELSDSSNRVKFDNFAAMVEKRYDNERLMSINNELKYGRTLWVLVSVIAILMLIIVFIVYLVRVQRKEREIANSREFIYNLQLKINQTEPSDSVNIQKALQSSTDIIRQLLNLSFLHGNNETIFYERFSTIMSIKSNRKELLNVLMSVTEAKHPEHFELIGIKYPMLNENDIIFWGLSLGGFSYQELSVIYQIEYHSVVVRLSRIKKKICACDDNMLTTNNIYAR